MNSKKLTPNALAIFLMITYMVSYITRINFGAVIVEMVSSTGFSKTELSAAVTGSFLTYGLGQVISGWFGDKYQPKILILLGLLVSSSMNLLIPVCPSPMLMTAVWCINGLAQAFMWPPIVRLMVNLCTEEEYAHTSIIVSYGSASGTILIYLITPLIISITSWRFVFIFSAVCGFIMAAVWNKLCPELKKVKLRKKQTSKGIAKIMFSPLMLAIMLAIISQGALKDGITTWMPTYIAETYKLGNSIAILTGIILPVFTMICIRTANLIHSRFIKSTVFCAGAIFLVSLISSVLLLMVTGKDAISSTLLSALLTGCMHGVNYMLIVILPSFFKSTGFVSLISGLLNACTYIGSALSTYGIAILTDNYGWNTTIAVWIGIAALGTLLCFAFAPVWKKKYND